MFLCWIKRKCLLLLNCKWFFSSKCRELQAVQCCQQETLRRFARYLISLCQPYVLQMQRNELSTTFIIKTLLIFLKYMFQFFINKALSASNSAHYPGCQRLFYSRRTREKPPAPRVSFHRQNFMIWKVLNLQFLCNISCRGAIDNSVTLHVNCLGFDPGHWKLFFVFVFLVLFFKAYFHFLTHLNYIGKLISSSLSAFIAKVINPRVSHQHPLIVLGAKQSKIRYCFSPSINRNRDTLGARDFSRAVSDFCQVFIVTRSWLRPTRKIPAAREKNLWYPGYLII